MSLLQHLDQAPVLPKYANRAEIDAAWDAWEQARAAYHKARLRFAGWNPICTELEKHVKEAEYRYQQAVRGTMTPEFIECLNLICAAVNEYQILLDADAKQRADFPHVGDTETLWVNR